MRYLVFDTMDAITEDTVSRLSQELVALGAEWRVKKALSYRHLFGQFACLKTYEMLYQLTGDVTPWEFNEHGKPFLPKGPFFNISHCKTALLVAVHDSPIGVDIESIRKAEPSLIKRTMNEREQEEIAASENADIAFTRLWTQKEATLKYKGTGIINDLTKVLSTYTGTTVIQSNYIYSIVC